MFRRPNEAGWGQDVAYPWILGVVGGLWIVAALVAVNLPVFEYGDFVIPVAAIFAPMVAAMLTWYACEFLVSGFAARQVEEVEAD